MRIHLCLTCHPAPPSSPDLSVGMFERGRMTGDKSDKSTCQQNRYNCYCPSQSLAMSTDSVMDTCASTAGREKRTNEKSDLIPVRPSRGKTKIRTWRMSGNNIFGSTEDLVLLFSLLSRQKTRCTVLTVQYRLYLLRQVEVIVLPA